MVPRTAPRMLARLTASCLVAIVVVVLCGPPAVAQGPRAWAGSDAPSRAGVDQPRDPLRVAANVSAAGSEKTVGSTDDEKLRGPGYSLYLHYRKPARHDP